MSQKTLEKVLEHLLNHEQDAAGELLHSYFVEKGRNIYESMIQADEQIEEEIGGDPVAGFEEEVTANNEEIENEEMFSEEDGNEEAPEEMSADEMPADEMGAEDEAGEDEGSAASAVEDAMMDVEDAISALKAEFEKLVSSEEHEEAGEEPEAAADAELGESVELKKVAVTHGDNGDAGAKDSPMTATFKKFDTGAEAAKFSGGADEKGGKAGAPKQNPDSPATTEPSVKPAPKASTTDGSDKSSKSTIAGK